MESTLVSVVIPVYNRENVIGETIDSVLRQTHRNWECIIVDDGSIDNTFAIVSKYVSKDKRLKLLERNRIPKGAPVCRNIGLSVSKGEFICFLDSDDVLETTFIEKQIEVLFSNIEASMVICQMAYFVDKLDNKRIAPKIDYPISIERYLSQDIQWFTSSVVWRRSFILSLGGFNEKLAMWQDWELNIRCLMNKCGMLVNDEVLLYYRYKWDKKQITMSSTNNGDSIKIRYLSYYESRMVLLREYLSSDFVNDFSVRKMVVRHLSCLPDWLISIRHYSKALGVVFHVVKLDRNMAILKPILKKVFRLI